MKSSLLITAAMLAGMAAAQTYCVPTISNGCSGTFYEYVSNVTISNVNNNTGCTLNPAFTDYTTSVPAVSLAAGGTYPVSVTIGNVWSTDRVYVMLDVDGNGTFDTLTGELLATLGPAPSTGGSYTVTGSITLPAAVAPSTRIRFRMSYGTLAPGQEPCSTSPFGETEDYAVATGGGPLVPEYQVNQANAAMDIDGVAGSAFASAQVTRCVNALFTVNLASPLTNNSFDVLLSTVPLVPVSGGALWTGTQAVNINLASFTFAFGGFTTPFFGTAAIPISYPSAVDLYTQMAIIDGANVDGVSLSQPNGLHILSGAGLAGYVPPTGDDTFNALPAPACLTFYGQTRNNAWLTTNGRVGFGTAGNTSYIPTVAAAMTGDAFIGYWNDLNVVAGTAIVASNPAAGVTRFQWNNVPYFGSAIANNFGIQIDNNVNAVQIDGPVGGFAVNAGNPATPFFGVSNGSGGSSDPGSINYGTAVAGLGTPAPNPGMIYNLGPRGMALGTYVGVIYIWNALSGNYDWTAF